MRALPSLLLAELSGGNARLAGPGATGQKQGVLAELGLGNSGLGERRCCRVGKQHWQDYVQAYHIPYITYVIIVPKLSDPLVVFL